MKLSIITITRNDLAGLTNTVASVLPQLVPQIEYIIIDGNSNDGTKDFMKNLSIQKKVSEPDSGRYQAFNKGILLAEGDWIGIVNSGDTLKEDSLAKILNYLEQHDSYDVCCGWIEIHKNGSFLRLMGHTFTRLPELMVPHMGCYIKRSIIDRVGMYDESYQLAGDYEYLLRIFSAGYKFIDMPLIVGEFQDGGISSTSTELLGEENNRLKLKHGIVKPYRKKASAEFLAVSKRYLTDIIKLLRIL